MLYSLNEIRGYAVGAEDDTFGIVRDLYFDDADWSIRYVVARTAARLLGRQVLIGRHTFGVPDWNRQQFSVRLTREQIENRPSPDAKQPVSRRRAADMYSRFAWPPHRCWTLAPTMQANPGPRANLTAAETDDAHLRSVKEVSGYEVHASDGPLGRIADFLADEEKWAVHWLVISTRRWLPGGRKVLVSPRRVQSISWLTKTATVDLTKEQIEKSPELKTDRELN